MRLCQHRTAPLRRREFHLGDDDFDALRELVKSHIGIHLTSQKRELVYGRVSRRLRALGMRDFREYRALLSDVESGELGAFCNAITTNLTAFFREPHHFDFLREWLVQRRGAQSAGERRLRFWCAGCSTGEEPYSLAMSLYEALGDLRGWDVRILATDVDTDVLAHAQRGVYTRERLGDMDAKRRSRYFRQRGEGPTGQYGVSPQLRELVCFRPLNLIHELPMKGPFDAVFCRNVVIYFDKDTQYALYARIAKLQHPGGLLFVGHSESLHRVSQAYVLVGKTIYRRC